MAKKTNTGRYLWRGGRKIELEKEEEVFTAILEDEEELTRVRALEGVEAVEPVQNRIFKVRVAQGKRDAAMEDMRSRKMNKIAHHAYRPRGDEKTRYYLTDKIVVAFKPKVARKTIESILAKAGVRILKEYGKGANTFLVQVTSDAGKNPIKVANALAALKSVAYAEPNLVNRFQSFYTPTDTLFNRQWHLQSWDGPDLVADADVSAVAAWDVTRGLRSTVVAVVDDGFDLGHPDFAAAGKVVHPKDYVDGDANPFPVTAEGDYHGTPCAGVALAEENGTGVVGIAPGCAFMPVRFPLSADDDQMWEIFDFVGQRADVISCSWGPPPVYAPLGQLLINQFHQLAESGGPRKKGCLIVFAAGNYNAPLKDLTNTGFVWHHPTYGNMNTTGAILNGNATHPDVVAVAASTSQNRKAAYSNWGAEIAVCAPSNNFHPLDNQAFVPGRGIWTTDNEQFGSGFTGGSRFTGRFGGTSSATPLVAGVAALVISANPALSAREVKAILQETADKIEDTQPDPVLGLTKGTYDQSGHSEWFGFGKVNAAAAVQRAVALAQAAGGPVDLALGEVAQDRLAQRGDTRLYKVTLGADLGVTLDGPAGQDFDLYVKKGSPPTTEDYEAIGYSAQADEKVVIPGATPGDYYILVRSYRGAGDFTVQAALD
jgi:subtilisin family serine protease